ncbi:MAG: 3-keto-5-aminohexanoate cleavage protein [Halobacteriales archaeon]
MGYRGYEDYFDKPVIISVAPTGGMHGKEANPNLPEQPEEIAEDVSRCAAAGASIVHVHARDEDGNPTKDPATFQEIRDRIDERCDDIIVNFTTGGGDSREGRIRPVLEVDPAPDIATVDLGPLNPRGESIAMNTRGQNEEYVRRMAEAGVKPELEAFGPGHLTEAHHLVEAGLLEAPYWTTLILGMRTGTIPAPRNLLNLVDNLPEGAVWQCMAIGRHQLPLTTMAMLLGGHVRVGLEDNVYYRRDELAKSNAQLVERAAAIADWLERPVASTAEAREILGL